MNHVRVFGLFLLVLILGSCDNESPMVLSPNEKSAVDTEKEYNEYANDLNSILQAAIQEANGATNERTSNDLLECAVVTIDGTRETGSITVDFGDGCEGPFGRVRKGVLEIEYTGNYFVSGSTYSLETVDFYIDDVKVEGQRNATNISESLFAPKFRIITTEGKLTWPDGSTLTREEERIHSFEIDLADQSFSLTIEGTASGVTRLGEEYSSTIQTPIMYESDCLADRQYVPSTGLINIERPDKPLINVDFGDGECNGTVLVSVGSISIEVNL